MKTHYLLKKCAVVLALFFGLIGMTNLSAQEFTIGDLNYRINDDGVSVTVTGHVDGYNATGELNIPESVSYNGNDYPVTIIGEDAFAGCPGLTGSLIIPNSVVEIGAYAFAGCYSFTGSLNIPNSVTYIGGSAFEYCEGFTGSLMISDNVTTIGDYAFDGCYGFTGSLMISDNVTTIGDYAFLDCYGFDGTLTIGNIVESIGYRAFSNCSGWDVISVDTENAFYDSRDNCNAIISTSDNILILGCKNTIIPNNIVEIGVSSFYGSGITTLSIPNSVQKINDHAFGSCGFTSITIPSSILELGINPFSFCEQLSSITVEADNPVYDSRNNCNAIINTQTNELITGCCNTVMLEGITSIGNAAFEGCSGLTGNLIIPNSITAIGFAAFNFCYNINGTLTIGNSVTSIGDFAFYGCSSITGSLIIPDSVVSIGYASFNSCYGLDVLIIGNSVNNIGDYAFAGCSGLSEVISKATIPPVFGAGEWYGAVFSNINCSTLVVPCGCVQAYENSFWHDFFTTIIEDCSDVMELDENLASVYPNPTNGLIKIEAENIQNVSIYNMLGEMVYESAATGNAFEYDFSNNESGVYLVRIETAQGVVTKRVTVM